MAVQKPYLQFFIKEFGTNLEYWTSNVDDYINSDSNYRPPIGIYQGNEVVGVIMPIGANDYEKHGEQEPTTKTNKPPSHSLLIRMTKHRYKKS